IPDLAFRHVTSDAIVLRPAACCQILLAGGELVTFLATRAIEINALQRFRLAMRIVARAAPQALPALSLAGALPQFFAVALGSHAGGAGAGQDEVSEMVGQQRSGPVSFVLRLDARNPRRSRQMTLRADAVPPCRIQLRRVDDFARLFVVT